MHTIVAATLPLIATASLTAGTLSDFNIPPIIEERKSTIKHEVEFSTSYSPEADWEERANKGEIELMQYELSHMMTIPLSSQTNLITGFFAEVTDIDVTGPAALPDRLMNVGIMLGATKDLTDSLGEGWSMKAILRPGFASDSSSISGSDFNLQGFAVVEYEYSSTLTWQLGVAAKLEGDLPVLPMLGIEWEFAPDWTLSLGVPETGIAYQMTPALRLRASGHFQGGSYHVDSQPRSGSDDTWLEYSEIRVGLGMDYDIKENMTLSLDGGVVVDRSFDYFDEDYEIEGDSGTFLGLGFRARF